MSYRYLVVPPMSFTPSSRIFALVDANNFYASCERVFKPALAGRPIVVLSNNDGCIIARSNEAKALGIRMGEPFYKARALIQAHQVQVFSANFTLYGDLSARVMNSLAEFTPELEIYSVDEAFLNLTGFERANLNAYGRLIKRSVEQWTGIPISIGIAETKTLAKIANHLAKKSKKANGVLDLTHSKYRKAALQQVTVADVWGVGRKYADKLHRHGIYTAFDLQQVDDAWLFKTFPAPFIQTVQELRGIACLSIEQASLPKSLVCSRSFAQPEESLGKLKESVATYTAHAAERLRKAGMACHRLLVFVQTNRFRQSNPQYSNSTSVALVTASQDTSELIQAAHQALRHIFKEGYAYHKAGVMLLDLVPLNAVQGNLFDPLDRAKRTVLMNALDQINHDFGLGSIRYAAEGLSPRWRMKQEHRSPRYTTCWSELAQVNA